VVEHLLPKQRVAGSSPVSRSRSRLSIDSRRLAENGYDKAKDPRDVYLATRREPDPQQPETDIFWPVKQA
jgi:hypothetical protein